jgi:hypothetical protein
MNNKIKFFGILALMAIVSCSKDDSGSVIDPGTGSGSGSGDNVVATTTAKPISTLLVGTNAWYKNPTDQVWTLTQQCGIASIRIGGNNYNDVMPSKAELLDWVKRTQAMGAEPIMQISQFATTAAAADYVKYFNVDLASGKKIKYWNIGNEPWLKLNQPATSTMGALVEAYFKPLAAAMKEIDPTIKIYGHDECYYMEDATNDLFGGKNNIAGLVPGKSYYYCDGISWHKYPQDATIDLAYAGIDQFKADIIKCKAKVDAVNIQLNRTGDNKLGWSIGEYNAKDGPLVHTWKNGEMFAGILDLCMKYGATYTTSWSMFEHGGDRQGSDYSFIDGLHMTPRATYRHMEMVAKNFSGNYVEGKSSSSTFIVFGSVNGGKISVIIMNRSNVSKAFNLKLNYAASVASGSTVEFNVDAGSALTYSGTIDGSSTYLYVFDNGHITRTTYSESNFNNEQAPIVTQIQ